MHKNNNSGFTLVELAIVLVVISMLVGSVLQGQELIKQAKIRNLLSTLQEIDTANNTFRVKYDALPGDFSRACAVGLCVTPGTSNVNVSDTAAGSGLAANGNGNGALEDLQNGVSSASGEIANFWVHLSNAKLVKGNFSQAFLGEMYDPIPSLPFVADAMADPPPPPPPSPPGTAILPKTPFGSGIMALSNNVKKLTYVIGAPVSIVDSIQDAVVPTNSAITADIARSIDNKLDDGVPVTGSVRTFSYYDVLGNFVDATASSTDCNNASTYNVAVSTAKCTLRFN